MGHFLKKLLKVILWIAVSFLLMFTLVYFIIRIPGVQSRLSHFATNLIISKTHTRVELKQITLSFPKSVVVKGLFLDDLNKDTLVYAGEVKVNLRFKDLLNKKIHISAVSLDDARIYINNSATDSLFNVQYLLAALADTSGQVKVKPDEPSQWTFIIDKVNLDRIRIHFDDAFHQMKAGVELKHLSLKTDRIDLEKSIYAIDQLVVDDMTASFISAGLSVMADVKNLDMGAAEIDLKKGPAIKVKRLDVEGNSLSYQTGDHAGVSKGFDATNINLKKVILSLSSVFYSPEVTEGIVEKFSATGSDGFLISDFTSEFSMDLHSVTAKKLKIKTTNSVIDADVKMQYLSLQALKESLNSLVLDLTLKTVQVSNSDITYFVPTLDSLSFFKDGLVTTTASGRIKGSVNNLSGTDFLLKTGSSTVIKSDFIITGLPDMDAAIFHFPNLSIVSGKKDVAMLAGPSVLQGIEIPEKIGLQIVFNGGLKAFTAKLDLKSTFGAINANAEAHINGDFDSKVSMSAFNLGRLLKNEEMFGPVSLKANAKGTGWNKNTIRAKIKAEVAEVYLNRYNYHNLIVDGILSGKEFSGTVGLNDENAVFEFNGLVNLDPENFRCKFMLEVLGADLQKLHLSGDDIRVAMNVNADIQGRSLNDNRGRMDLTNVVVVHEGKKYQLDSLLFATINGPDSSASNLTSALIGLDYKGNVSLAALPSVMNRFIGQYFPISAVVAPDKPDLTAAFDLDIHLHNHPILSEVLLPQLKAFTPGVINVSFNGSKSELKINSAIPKIIYGTTEVRDLAITVISDAKELKYSVSSSKVTSSQINMHAVLLEGRLADQAIYANLSSIDDHKNKTIVLQSKIVMQGPDYKVSINPKEFYLMNDRWNIAADNYLQFGKQGLLIHHFSISNSATGIDIASVNDRFNDDLKITVRNLKLDDISRFIEKDSSLVKGTADISLLLKRVGSTYGIIADGRIGNLIVHDVPIGNLTVKASNPESGRFDVQADLSGNENQFSARGYFQPGNGAGTLDISVSVKSLAMKTIEAFSMGEITEASGNLSGDFTVKGELSGPEITGQLIFINTLFKPAALNSRLELKNETVRFDKSGIFFKEFTILDADAHPVTVNGSIGMVQFKNLNFDLLVNSKDFLLFNTSAKSNEYFHGKMIIDSRIAISGPLKLPVINAKVLIKKGSNFTFAVPDDKLTVDKGEGVVEFADPTVLHRILSSGVRKDESKLSITGVDLTSVIEIDKQASLRLLMDPSSTDSLVVRGDAALSFAIDRSGKMSLTGAYNLNEGSYLVSLESVIKRKFDIIPGSTIIWSGDPLDADISINATYTVRASPIDLVADQISGLNMADKNSYQQRYPFIVLLKLRGPLLQPVISFEIQLAPADKGILGGTVNQKLNMLKEDESSLNKQVFALLVLGRFIQENPLQTETGGTSSMVRSTVGKLISAQLNQLSSKVVPGMELNFDIQSYDQSQSGEAKGRTQVELGLKKQLFNERLTVQMGGTLDVEGEKVAQNSASSITSDMAVEYKLSKDGSYRLKAFRHNQYEGAIEGQLVETGVGILFLRDFNNWKELMIRRKSEKGLIKKEKLP